MGIGFGWGVGFSTLYLIWSLIITIGVGYKDQKINH